MFHDHACIGAEATYCAAVALGLFTAALTVGVFVAMHALRAARRLWRRLGEAEERTRVRL